MAGVIMSRSCQVLDSWRNGAAQGAAAASPYSCSDPSERCLLLWPRRHQQQASEPAQKRLPEQGPLHFLREALGRDEVDCPPGLQGCQVEDRASHHPLNGDALKQFHLCLKQLASFLALGDS